MPLYLKAQAFECNVSTLVRVDALFPQGPWREWSGCCIAPKEMAAEGYTEGVWDDYNTRLFVAPSDAAAIAIYELDPS